MTAHKKMRESDLAVALNSTPHFRICLSTIRYPATPKFGSMAAHMGRVRTRISVSGFTAAQVRDGLPHLVEEFRQRPWLLAAGATWDDQRSRLVVTVESEGNDPRIKGGVGGANFDEVWDCVNACFNFTSDGIQFDIESSDVV